MVVKDVFNKIIEAIQKNPYMLIRQNNMIIRIVLDRLDLLDLILKESLLSPFFSLESHQYHQNWK
jgi:hypothetical protein